MYTEQSWSTDIEDEKAREGLGRDGRANSVFGLEWRIHTQTLGRRRQKN